MRSRNAFERGAVAAFVTLITTGAALEARADDKQLCSDAYAATQTLRKDGKLQAAREQALVCVRETCADFVRTDCTQWLGEIESSQPTVVVEVRDASGADVLDAKIELDGQPWLSTVDTKAHPIDPGSHTLRATTPKGAAEHALVVREGDKNIRATIALVAEAPKPLTPAASAPSDGGVANEPPPDSESGASIAPWVIGGSGLAVGAVGTILGIVVLGKHSTYEDHCAGGCDAEALDAKDSGEGLAPISTALILTGAVAVGVGVVWLVASSGEEPEQAISVRTGPVVTGDGAAWRIGGSF